jgi:hypothetical protein
MLLLNTLITSLAGELLADENPTFYDPVDRQLEGWSVAVDPRLLAEDNAKAADAALAALANHLQRVRYILPEDRVAQLQRVRIWIELDNAKLTSMQYHPNRKWLVDHGHDPRLTRHVHIPRAATLVERRTWAKHPYAVLHELAHAYHDQVLSFDEPEILAAFQTVKKEGTYDKVLLFTGEKNVRHYALSNHLEYFAESSEAYLGVNDFYPFVRAELREHDPVMFSLMEKIWGEVR